MRFTHFLLLFFFTCFQINAQNTAWQRANKLEKGFNLSNWLEAYWLNDNYPDVDAYKKSDLAYLKSIGMKSVRMPMLFEWYSDTIPPYTLHETHKAYKLIDSVIKWTNELNMNLIIDNHHGRDLNDHNYQKQIPRLSGMWKNIILKYEYLDPERVFFELRNEPKNDISNQHLREVNHAIIDTIRKYNTSHTLIVGANHWNSGESLIVAWPYSDKNIIYTFHNYSPHKFTHQGFAWTDLPSGVKFPESATDEEDLKNQIKNVKSWSDKYNVPVFLGEFGVSTHADDKSRCNWISTIGSVIDEYKIPWAYWDAIHDQDSFGFFKNSILSDDMILSCFKDALGLVTGTASIEDPEDYDLKIYPNPFKNRIFIQFNKLAPLVKIQIFDSLGKSLDHQRFKNNKVLDLSYLNEGLYLLRIRSEDMTITKKIIKN